MIDKHIHQDEFRLRVLLTNQCNKSCDFCLNDFQDKEPEKMAFAFDLNDCIRAYGQFMKSIKETSIITFSGGEPGIYPFLEMALSYAWKYCDVVKVVTNGTAFKENLLPYVDRWNIHVTRRLPLDKYYEYSDRITIQIVVTDGMHYDRIVELVNHYHQHRFLVKLFVDFHSRNKDILEERIIRAAAHFGNEGICTRFTGVQVNRGKACEGCDKDCVTLKALWYFPDGSSSTCPQGYREKYDHDSWDETMEVAYAAHKKE